ncbi:FMN-binding protein [Clostridium estertheticum]|uniref:FMN-binding protein n=1 Tax=Clostridium estertheticum TaxID=238834 RepID=A0AA47EKX9_9CLOT|nr:FMN-binding protein [Clostridium estertheticum]MBU3154590.1 FMN-binding protein [Clostridium estertheticum]MBU3201044.1 FMN-binding protein [Clostridium estertheticum]WAG61980.1 FMN-binding protein [Clostridium estertheticum]WAG63898.1 FMN-binding protein [Clostridium estertheticum]
MINVKKILIGVICVVVLAVSTYEGKYLISVQKYKQIVKGIKIDTVDLSEISDGKYTGSCDAIVIGAKVAVTVKNHKITSIVLLEHKTERGKPAEVIPARVVKTQSLQVDTITGATNSSKVILKSIENALNSGKI